MPARRAPSRVFVNVPYDGPYERLFVSLIAGLVALGRQPVCALAAPDTGKGRLRRILDLIARCDLSIHDLSRVQRARGVPRFNMPFELGLCCAVARFRRGHRYYVFEEQRHRLSKSLSDLGGYDPQVHGGTPRGIAGPSQLLGNHPPRPYDRTDDVAWGESRGAHTQAK